MKHFLPDFNGYLKESLNEKYDEEINEKIDYFIINELFSFGKLTGAFTKLFSGITNIKLKKQISNYSKELIKLYVERARLSLEDDIDDLEDMYDYDDDIDKYSDMKKSKNTYNRNSNNKSPHDLKKETIENKINLIESQMDSLSENNENIKKFINIQKFQVKLKSSDLIYKLADDKQKEILTKYKRNSDKILNNIIK